jgi:hypothetical protein
VKIHAEEFLTESWRLLSLNRRRSAIALAILAIPGLLIDLTMEEPDRVSSLLGFVALFLQFWITARLLEDFGRRSANGGGFGSVFVISLISVVAVLLGFVLLIVPGVILFARWSMAVPIAVGEGGGATVALAESWRRTEGRFWPIITALAAIYLPAIALFLLILWLFPEARLLQALFENVVLNGVFVMGWHAAIAFHLATSAKQSTLGEVFA